MSSDLTPEDRELLKALLDEGKFIPDRYRGSLFADAAATELIWPGKTTRVETAVLPFQSIEHIDEPRQETSAIPSLFDMDSGSGRQVGGWTNKLIWGDNRLVLSSLAGGPMRREIENAGGIKLVYIDPPFDLGANFAVDVEIGEESVTKSPSVIEQIAYRDTWGDGINSYVAMMYERLALISALMSDDALLWVHCDYRVMPQLKLICDEIFGTQRFRNLVTWRRGVPRGMKSHAKFLPNSSDFLLLYGREGSTWNLPKTEQLISIKEAEKKYQQDEKGFFRTSDPGTYTDASLIRLHSEGRIYVSGGGEVIIEGNTIRASKGKLRVKYYRELRGDKIVEETTIDNIWDDVPGLGVVSGESVGYPTQKPTGLLRRIIESSTEPGDLVADFFCGSGTTPAVAEQLGRSWLACDLGRFAVHTTRKRLIEIQRKRQKAGDTYRAFEVLNLGAYERQHFVGIDANSSGGESDGPASQREEAYVSLILSAYSGERATGTPPFHGVKGSTAVVVGPIDAPVTEQHVKEAIAAAVDAGITRVDVLGFEFEMGLKPLLQDEARERGVNLALRYIPIDVFDTRAVKSGDVKFHDVAYVEFVPSLTGRDLTVTLQDFAVFYRQEDAEAAAVGLRTGASRVVVDNGQVVKVSKDKKGIVTRDVLTGQWADWIDYWAVDFDYMSQPEIIRMLEDGAERQVKTGRYIFENRWQSFRTKQSRELELTSAAFQYTNAGTFKVAVKVIDIFGNDTTRVMSIKVKG